MQKPILLAAAILAGLCSSRGMAEDGHWVTTWATAPQLTEPGNLPPVPLAHRSLRQFVRTSIPAKRLRVRFSNAYGDSPVVIGSARLARAAGTGSAGVGEIDPPTSRGLTFRGAPGAVLAAGQTLVSDPLEFDLPATANVAISIRFGEISATTVTGHPGSRTTSFIADGDQTQAAKFTSPTPTVHWYLINGIEVLAGENDRAVAILGDSITDGRGSTTDDQNRWPDQLAKRLAAAPATAGVGIANLGIGGNAIFGGLGPSAVNRFKRDILGQPGVRHVILFEGVNDIGGASDANAPNIATNLINTYTDFANQAHAKGLKIHGATITPFGTNGYYTAAREAARQTVNQWFRTNQILDGVIDFDAAVRDPATPANLRPAFSDDGLHLTPAGYQAMADSIDLGIFTP